MGTINIYFFRNFILKRLLLRPLYHSLRFSYMSVFVEMHRLALTPSPLHLTVRIFGCVLNQLALVRREVKSVVDDGVQARSDGVLIGIYVGEAVFVAAAVEQGLQINGVEVIVFAAVAMIQPPDAPIGQNALGHSM